MYAHKTLICPGCQTVWFCPARLRILVVMELALHAKGRGFDPHRSHFFGGCGSMAMQAAASLSYENASILLQAMCFLAGANSIFDGDKLLTTANNERDEDAAMFAALGLTSRPAFLPYPAGAASSNGAAGAQEPCAPPRAAALGAA